jgi:hypothetical protein
MPQREGNGPTHAIHRHTDERGYRASCLCGWFTSRRTRELRDQDVDAHQLEAADNPGHA